MEKSNDGDIKAKYKKKLKYHNQKLIQHLNWQYTENIVTPKNTGAMYNTIICFWIYIKHAKTDHQ